jgi:hypothetical protein
MYSRDGTVRTDAGPRPIRLLVFFRYAAAVVLVLALLLSLLYGRGVIWAAYLTHWTMLLQAFHATTSALVAWSGPGGVVALALQGLLPCSRTMAFVVSGAVTLLYWVGVHDWSAPLAGMSVVEHGLGYLVMALDVFASGTLSPRGDDANPARVRASHLLAIYAAAVLFVVWSLIFYSTGLTDNDGHHYLYSILDWGEVPQTLGVVAAVFVFVLPGGYVAAYGLQMLGAVLLGASMYEDAPTGAAHGAAFVLLGGSDDGNDAANDCEQ